MSEEKLTRAAIAVSMSAKTAIALSSGFPFSVRTAHSASSPSSSANTTFCSMALDIRPKMSRSNGTSETSAKSRSRRAYACISRVWLKPCAIKKQYSGNASRPMQRNTPTDGKSARPAWSMNMESSASRRKAKDDRVRFLP